MNDKSSTLDFSKCGLLVPEDSVKEDDLKTFGDEFYSTLLTDGFAFVSNHGMEWSLVDEVNEVSERFYANPAEFKLKFELPGFELSYESIGRTKFDGEREDYYESFRTCGVAYTDEKYVWPNEEMKKCYTKFTNASAKVLLRLIKALSYGMKLKDREYAYKSHSLINQKGNKTVVKQIRYPPIVDDDAASEHRIGVHSDRTTLSLLFQDDIGGLQVFKNPGEVVDAHPVPGAILVIPGDIMEAWSGKRLMATKHHVTVPVDASKRSRVRRSIVYFVRPNETTLMKKLAYEGDPNPDDANDDKALTIDEFMAKSLAKHINNLT